MWRYFLDPLCDDSMVERDLGTIAREQHQGRSSAELVSWLFPISDTLVVNKDGAVMACFEFEGLDTDSHSVNALAGLASALNKWLVDHQDIPLTHWWNVRRVRTSQYPESEFPDPISQFIDDAQRTQFLEHGNYINRHYLSLALQPFSGALRVWERIALAIEKGTPLGRAILDSTRTLFDEQCVFPYSDTELEDACDRFERILGTMAGAMPEVRFRRLAADDLGQFLGVISSPHAPERPVACSPTGSYPLLLDEHLPTGSWMVGRDFVVSQNRERKFTVAVTIGKYHNRLDLGAFDRLYTVPGELTISFTLRHMSRFTAEAHAERLRNFHSGKKTSWKATVKAASGDLNSGPVNQGRERLADEAAGVLGRLTDGSISGLWMYIVVLCHGDTLQEADEVAARVEAVLQGCRIRPEIENLHLMSAVMTAIPGGHKECARWRFCPSDAFSMIAPVHTVARGDPECKYLTEQTKRPTPAMIVLPTEHSTPFYFSPFVNDLGHGMLGGPSRSGKSVIANLLWTMFRRWPNAQVIVMDRDLSSRIPILLQGGTYLDFRTGDAGYNPMHDLSADTLESKLAWIEGLLAQRGYKVDSEDAKELEQSLRSTLTLPASAREFRRLSTVFSHLTRPRLKEALEQWVGDRAFARYFDNVDDVFQSAITSGSRLIGLEVGKLLKHEQVAAPMMDHIFGSIDRMLLSQREDGVVRPTFIHLAEVSFLLKNPAFADQMENWLKTLAKRCACVWMDTQSIENYSDSPIWSAIRDNVPNRIFLPNRLATSESLYGLYQREFELTGNQILRIAEGTQKRDYFIQHGGLSRMVQIPMQSAPLACLRSDVAAQICFDKHYLNGEGVPGWRQNYIADVQGL